TLFAVTTLAEQVLLHRFSLRRIEQVDLRRSGASRSGGTDLRPHPGAQLVAERLGDSQHDVRGDDQPDQLVLPTDVDPDRRSALRWMAAHPMARPGVDRRAPPPARVLRVKPIVGVPRRDAAASLELIQIAAADGAHDGTGAIAAAPVAQLLAAKRRGRRIS